ncbi:MAG: TonB-dependent receptor plug domain-containing protein [Fluviicola sp.]|nr:TonB-dependent receptor plug domain-containing protein [Fluviicola sp.]MBP6272396.1 TonB-dependent receptor plug domain-containing protein [Fluviicola sp.]
MLKTILFFVALLSTSFAISQYTEIEEVILIGKKVDSTRIYRLDEKRIASKNAADVGELVRYLPGVQVTAYGGIGGLKTANFRSLGAGQTSVVYDHQAQSTTQSGATDLGLIPADFITEIAVIQLASTDVFLPIKSKLSGSILAIQSKHQASDYNKNGIIGLQSGSFGLVEGFGLVQKRWNKLRLTLSGKSRFSEGSYPFDYKNGNTIISSIRKNNQVIDHYGQFSCNYFPSNNHSFSFGLTGNRYNKQLPGAVIFYNDNAQQYLNGNQIDGFLRYVYSTKNIQLKTQINHHRNELIYLDSNYLNAAGFLKNEFQAQQIDGECQVKFMINQQTNCLVGTNIRTERLHGEKLSVQPNRIVSESIIGLTNNRFGNVNAQVGWLTVNDNFSSSAGKQYVLPSLDWMLTAKKIAVGITFRQSLRLPTFSEMYYQQIGNSQLLPEKGTQFSLRMLHNYKRKKSIIQTIIQPFYAHITNKINAIPSKNLFIWSIQNIGQTRAFGTEVSEQISMRVKNGIVGLSANYTFQYCIDITDRTSATYKDVISYSPLHTGGLEINYSFKQWRVFSQFNYQGKRFALNENIPANELAAFSTIDIGGSAQLNRNKQLVYIRLTVNNITNQNYNYINYFVMPGINFHLKLTYEI